MNLQDMMVYRDASSRVVDKYLMAHEGRVIAVRKHPAVLLLPVVGAFLGLVACLLLTVLTGFLLLWWLWLPALGYLLWRVLNWSIEFFVVTEHRVMLINGVLNRNVVMTPVAKVTDITLDRSPVGRVLGYGKFVLETGGQADMIKNVDHMPYPEQLYLEVSEVIFSAEDKSPD